MANPNFLNMINGYSSTTDTPFRNRDSYMVSPMIEVVLKTRLHCGCEGCISKLARTLLDVKGVQCAKFYVDEKLIKVYGTMDTKELLACLRKKLDPKVEMSKPKRHTSKTDTSRGKLTSFNS